MTTTNERPPLNEVPKQLDPRKTVEMIENLLKRARAGEITEFMIVCWTGDGHFFTQGSATNSLLHRVGALETLKFDAINGSL